MMSTYFMGAEEIIEEHGESAVPPCGTAACIAGHAILLGSNLDLRRSQSVAISLEAEKILGLGICQGERLFHEDQWPEAFDTSNHIPHTREYALNAVARIQHFIKTEGRE